MQPISVLLADDNLAFLRMLTHFLQGHYDSEVVVVGAAGAIAKAHGLNLGRLVSEPKAAQEAIEAKGRPDAMEDLRPPAPLRPFNRS